MLRGRCLIVWRDRSVRSVFSPRRAVVVSADLSSPSYFSLTVRILSI